MRPSFVVRGSFIALLLMLAGSLVAPRARAQDAAAQNAWQDQVRSAVESDQRLASFAPTDAAAFCPSFTSLDESGRRAFWTNLLTAMAQQESGGDPTKVKWSLFDSSVNRPAFRRGLFQISIEAAHSHRYACDVSSGELSTASANIACALTVLETEVSASNSIGGAGRYWPSLRHQDSRAQIASAVSAAAPCTPAAIGASAPR